MARGSSLPISSFIEKDINTREKGIRFGQGNSINKVKAEKTFKIIEENYQIHFPNILDYGYEKYIKTCT